MLDIRFIREHRDLVQDGARKKHIDVDIDQQWPHRVLANRS